MWRPCLMVFGAWGLYTPHCFPQSGLVSPSPAMHKHSILVVSLVVTIVPGRHPAMSVKGSTARPDGRYRVERETEQTCRASFQKGSSPMKQSAALPFLPVPSISANTPVSGSFSRAHAFASRVTTCFAPVLITRCSSDPSNVTSRIR